MTDQEYLLLRQILRNQLSILCLQVYHDERAERVAGNAIRDTEKALQQLTEQHDAQPKT